MPVTHEWRKDGLLLQVMESSVDNDMDIVAVHGLRQSKLLIRLPDWARPDVCFQDLQGNGYHSGYQGQGLGTLLVNTALQILKMRFQADLAVVGEISNVGDPDGPEHSALKEECRLRRVAFWESFGFRVIPEDNGHPKITAMLSKLSEKRSGLVLNRFPRFVPLEEFAKGSERGCVG